ncbi:type II toxin-antitoxin system RelE/ParE family toxin [Vibrio splendidus]|uniref:type II toxin-antitoxin system RelE/ParE family toxin n=1 Tax=Vibrio splendidus TaxID=29497 RepID=UPI000C823533|nr:type II toxin-antitoxin system RelE/ParE family toxin [Vibrio splendidus]PMM16824.1 hypothetical protein BCT62_05245 [Vibrio splendidus]PMN26592.1 hypothetical protein BCT36_01275 [Vibrio splendidus]
MDHIVCINQNSFPAENSTEGAEKFAEAIQGVLELQSGTDRFLFYLDSNTGTLSDFEIANGYTYDNFIKESTDYDLMSFLYEIEDKSPALDNLSEEQIEEMTAHSFYIASEPAAPYPDVYALSWAVSGYLLSISTSENWAENQIYISRADSDGRYVDDLLTLNNISNQNHGAYHYERIHSQDIETIIEPHTITPHTIQWFNEQTAENRVRITDKLELARNREFNGGRPLFETLTGGEGLREVRIPAFSGGAIRILFKHLKDNKQALLVGFIKKSNGGGYEQAQIKAGELYEKLLAKE